MKNAKFLLTSTTLVASVFLLISCGKQQEKQTSQSSSSSQTVQTSKSDDKSEAKVVQSASQDETDVASASSEALTRKTQPLQQRVSMSMLWRQEIFLLWLVPGKMIWGINLLLMAMVQQCSNEVQEK